MVEKTRFTINLISTAINHKSTRVQAKNIDMNVIKIFYKLNLVKYMKKSNNNFEIYLKIPKNNTKIKNFHRTHSRLHFSANQIKKQRLEIQSNIFIFSTSQGFMNQYELVNKNLGGTLIFSICLK